MLWSELVFLRPAFISDEVWNNISSNLFGQLGNPLEDLPASLQNDGIKIRVYPCSSVVSYPTKYPSAAGIAPTFLVK